LLEPILLILQTASKSAIVPDEISWGEEPSWQEPHHQAAPVDNSNALLIEALQKQLQEAEESQAKLAEDLRASQVRCGKALKQLKTMKEQKKPASDLDKVMEEELQVITLYFKELETEICLPFLLICNFLMVLIFLHFSLRLWPYKKNSLKSKLIGKRSQQKQTH
jgi:hypothetical protein